MSSVRTSGRFPFFGNSLCLDFASTLRDRLRIPQDLLRGFPDLIEWLQATGVIDQRAARTLLTLCLQKPAQCQEAFARALELREAIYRIFSAIAAGRASTLSDVQFINEVLREDRGYAQLMPDKGNRYRIDHISEGDPLLRVLTPIAQSAAELLHGGRSDLIRRCAKTDCAGLFYDTSRTRRRRWCLMQTCGNLVKVKRYYRRHPRKRSRSFARRGK